MKVTIPKHSLLDDGEHPATLTSVEEATALGGTYLRWDFSVRTESGETVSRVVNLSNNFSRTTKAYSWLCKMLGRNLEPGEEVDFDEILPLACRVVIEKAEGEDGRVFDRITNVFGSRRVAVGAATTPTASVSDSPEASDLMKRMDSLSASDDDIPF